MAVKIELEKSEIADVVTALNMMGDYCRRVADTGRMNGKKISKDAGMLKRRQQKRVEKLSEFFNGLLG